MLMMREKSDHQEVQRKRATADEMHEFLKNTTTVGDSCRQNDEASATM